jgi:DNA-binding response OmpR family regulator
MSAPRPILVVEDDAALRATLAEQITLAGEFQIVEAETAADADAKLREADARYDAILLDVGLPDGCGREFCAKLRKRGLKIPVIMLTGADAEQDVVRGLDAGANDYIAKPFRLNELLARVRAQLRVFDNSEDAVFTIGPYMFRPSAKLLLEPAKNRKIRLKETNILKLLYRAAGRPVPRQVLLNEVWGLQQRGDHAHPGDPHLPPTPEDRGGPGQRTPDLDGKWRLQLGRARQAGGGLRRRRGIVWRPPTLT